MNSGEKNRLREGTKITGADSDNPFPDRLSAPVTPHICYGNGLGQLGVDLNAVIVPSTGMDCHSWRWTAEAH